jgi:chromosome segregation ATPase
MPDIDLTKRVTEIETLVFDIPRLVTLRLETLTAQLSEQSGRLNLLDSQMGMLLRDVRDLRGGVTRQLVHQDSRFDGMEQRIERVEQRLDQLEQTVERLATSVDRRLGGVESRLGEVDLRLGGLDGRLAGIETGLAEVLRRLPGP